MKILKINVIFYAFFLGNYPKESIQHSEHSERLKSRNAVIFVKTDSILKYEYIQLTSIRTARKTPCPSALLALYLLGINPR